MAGGIQTSLFSGGAEPQFEIGADGKITLRNNTKKIDLSKITREELIALGIDPNLSEKEIAKRLKVGYRDQ